MSEQRFRFVGASCRGYKENRITESTPLRDVVCKLVCMIQEVNDELPIRFRGQYGMSDLMQAAEDARFRILKP